MKRIFLLLAVLAVTFYVKAQDIIVTYENERIEAIIEEVSETQIKYKKKNNPKGPTFVLGTDKIATILYKDGTVQTFTKKKTQDTTPTLRDIAQAQEEKEKAKQHIPTPAEGPWLLYGVQIKEGYNMYIGSEYRDYENNTKYSSIFGMRFLPSIEGYVEYAPKQMDMGYKRHAVYMGLQYVFRGGKISSGVKGNQTLDLQYLCLRPAYSFEKKVFYSRTGLELGILTVSNTIEKDSYGNTVKENHREDCNKATLGIWEEFGWMIKDHFNIGFSFTYTLSNATKSTMWGNYVGNTFVPHKRYTPQIQLQIVLGWRFNPYKFDKKKIEPITLKDKVL
jgi:hypothetical protein